MRTTVKIVKVDTFCEDKYEALPLEKKDLDNIVKIRSINLNYKNTIDKYIKYHTLNEKEYQLCVYE